VHLHVLFQIVLGVEFTVAFMALIRHVADAALASRGARALLPLIHAEIIAITPHSTISAMPSHNAWSKRTILYDAMRCDAMRLLINENE
jgi:hypothetical protein